MKLVIVESPAKAKTINGYLGAALGLTGRIEEARGVVADLRRARDQALWLEVRQGNAAGRALYAATGFAVLHTVTQTFSGRAFVLGAAYAGTLFIGWPLIGMIGLGLADAVLGIRQAYWNRRGPPPLPTS